MTPEPLSEDKLAIGLRVRSNREFAGVPAGTPGVIIEASNSWPDSNSVAVQWIRQPGDRLVDWFAFDELEYLDTV